MPPPKLSISEWADKERRLSPEASAEPGRWDTARAEYQRGIMDSICNPEVSEVVVMCSAQVGKSEMLLNAIGYYISHDPAPMMIFQPTIEMAEAFSKDRIAPMIRDTPSLKAKIGDPKARDSGQTILHKVFQAGHLTIAGANSPSSLASRPVRIIFFDEVDRYDASAGTEGDPVNLGKKRATTFWNRRIALVSTPTIRGASRIEAAFNETDQRRFFVPCVHCGHKDHLQWSNVRWRDHDPTTAVYVCGECGGIHDDKDRAKMVRQGEWRATSEAAAPGLVGFHLNELYSPWRKLREVVADFLSAKKSQETLKTWINTSLGETWEAGDLKVAASDLAKRAEDYELGVAPHGVCELTAGVDVQDDRLEFTVFGWGEGEECWVVDYGVIAGNPTLDDVWTKLDEYLSRPIRNVYGHDMRIRIAAIDSGGHHTQRVYQFCRERPANTMAIKGHSTAGRPVISRPTQQDVSYNGVKVPHGVALWLVGTDVCKHTITARLGIVDKGAQYIHFPQALPVEYYHQLTAERLVTKYRQGVAHTTWQKSSGARNEALDMAVYGYAAAVRIGIPRMPPEEWRRARDSLSEPLNNLQNPLQSEKPAATVAAPARTSAPVRKSKWLEGSRRGGTWL